MNTTKLSKHQFVFHIICWIAFMLIVVSKEIPERNQNVSSFLLVQYFISFSGIISLAYLNLYLLIPKFLKRKSYFKYLFFLLVSIVGIGTILTLIQHFGFSFIDCHTPMAHFFHMISSSLGVITITSFIYFLNDWIKWQDTKINLQDVENQKRQAELQALKAQINPHFLFNTLNNIYSLSLDKSDKTPEMILKLSDLMSYILYDCKADWVTLNREIDFIRDYVELEKLRFDEQLQIQMKVEITESIRIAPLLFVPLIENCFKYAGNTGNLPSLVEIYFVSDSNSISFVCKNSIDTTNHESKKASGIGIENVKKRLELIYPEKYTFVSTQTQTEFRVELTLQIHGNKMLDS